jgi:hypothetical protein
MEHRAHPTLETSELPYHLKCMCRHTRMKGFSYMVWIKLFIRSTWKCMLHIHKIEQSCNTINISIQHAKILVNSQNSLLILCDSHSPVPGQRSISLKSSHIRCIDFSNKLHKHDYTVYAWTSGWSGSLAKLQVTWNAVYEVALILRL